MAGGILGSKGRLRLGLSLALGVAIVVVFLSLHRCSQQPAADKLAIAKTPAVVPASPTIRASTPSPANIGPALKSQVRQRSARRSRQVAGAERQSAPAASPQAAAPIAAPAATSLATSQENRTVPVVNGTAAAASAPVEFLLE